MISPDELRREIAALEAQETSWQTLQRLAILYAIQFRMIGERPSEADYSRSAPPQTIVIPPTVLPAVQDAPVQFPESEFAQAASGLTASQIVLALDDHMEAIRAVYPAEYSAILKRLRSIK